MLWLNCVSVPIILIHRQRSWGRQDYVPSPKEPSVLRKIAMKITITMWVSTSSLPLGERSTRTAVLHRYNLCLFKLCFIWGGFLNLNNESLCNAMWNVIWSVEHDALHVYGFCLAVLHHAESDPNSIVGQCCQYSCPLELVRFFWI